MKKRHAHMHAHVGPPYSGRLSRSHRRMVCGILTAAWLSGILWLVFHYFLMRRGEFGAEPHPLEAWWLRLHGAAAFASLWLGGLVWAVHVRSGLARPKRRISGMLLIALFVVLAASGYLLYYAGDDALRDAVRLVHWLIGVALIVPFLIHSLRARSARHARLEQTSAEDDSLA
ncbi:MAG TPA: hypothetical protein VIE67_07650 [Rudaea sp.]|jgi:hypothetical protein|uniref:hypothetical protein n=1 Tax=Rudaea sp. TaxID=2136325 RepID=UPI002F937752